ncbi:MAG: hypothetical protein U1F83_16260 [Verrucomicrobiota bacterium]
MFELTDIRPDIKVQEAEYKRLLGLPPNYELEGRTRELADAAARWYAEHGRPWIYARQNGEIELTNDRLKLSGNEFCSQQLHDQFAQAKARSAVLIAVSAGKECEEHARVLWQDNKPDEYFFLEMFGSAVVENLITVASGQICGWADSNGMVALPHYSPGYSGWDVADQIKLWDLIRLQNGRELPGELHVMDTGMLRPKKSLLAIVGITADVERARQFAKLVPCENCSLPACDYRRAPYKHTRPPIEDVRRLQATPLHSKGNSAGTPVLIQDAKYSINARALRKWSQERLVLKTLPDGSVEAQFRYDGTTCSNMGQPLQFHYHIKLSPPADGYRITEANCTPAPGDTGHTQQCEYLNDAIALMGSIANEKPLLGRSLNDVLTWERATNPSGCYCDLERRLHKWGLVFEVIHHTLVQHEKQSANGNSNPILKQPSPAL